MAVNPDDLLIFKLREKPKQTPEPAAVAAQPPEAARQQPPAGTGQGTAASGTGSPGAQAGQGFGAGAQYYSPDVQAQMAFPAPQKQASKGKEVNALSYLAGTLFLISAGVFMYLTLPQAIYLLNYISTTGAVAFLSSFLISLNYDYATTLMNMALVALSAACGLLMFARPDKAHRLSGLVSGLVILLVTFEYLSGGEASDLLVVVVLAFFEIGILAYVSMTASSRAAEAEEIKAEEMLWPRVETF